MRDHSAMTPEQWQKVKAVLERALGSAPEERQAFLDEACGADNVLRAEVESLLAAGDGSDGFLEPLSARSAASLGTDPDLAGILQAALGSSYRIDRELGGGGMSRVFVAEEVALGRRVVVKVLPPELAADVDARRFRREVRLAARLQHPHIVPLLAAGEVEGLLYYTMPYVAGESLRERLTRERPLPVDEALRLAGDVADALHYAHGQGVAHRDVKPGNILLSGGHALVTDFGIAQALSGSEVSGETPASSLSSSVEPGSGTGPDRLTATGLMVGTPQYMSPEQASGDGVDGRSDIYSLGCVLYEMLAGEPPHAAATTRKALLQALHEPPPPLRNARPEVPLAVEQALARSLAPAPDARFQNAGEFAQALATSRASTALPLRRWRSRGVVAVLLMLLAAMGATAGGYMVVRELGIGRPSTLLSTGFLQPRERLLIADFRSRTPDSLLGLTVADAFRTDFARSSVVTTMSLTQVAEALERTRRPATARLDPALAREVAIRQGIKTILTGEVSTLGKGYLISAQLVASKNREVLVADRETAEDVTRIIAAVDRLSKRLREHIGESLSSLRSEPPLDEVTTSSLEALWKYNQAMYAAHVKSDTRRTIMLLEEAVALDTGFATAYRSLGAFLFLGGERERAVAAFNKALQHRDRLTSQERDHTLALYYHLVTAELHKAAAIYRDLLERYPTDSLAMSNLGTVYMTLGQPVRAESLFRRWLALDSVQSLDGASLIYWHLVRAQVESGRAAEAERTFTRMRTRFGDSTRTVGYAGIMLANARGDYGTSEARIQTFQERHRENGDRRTADRELAALASARGRLAQAERYLRDAMRASLVEPQPLAYLEDAVSLGFLDIWFRRRSQHGIQTIEAALKRFPLVSIKPLNRPYLDLAIAYASAGEPVKARALLTEYERVVDPTYRRFNEHRRRWTWGIVALAEGRLVEAIGELRLFAASPRDCVPCGLAALARAYDQDGQADSAIAVYERYIGTPDLGRLDLISRLNDDATQLAPAHKRLGELYLQRGDSRRARNHYARFVELWRDSDGELRASVLEVKRRVQELDRDQPAERQVRADGSS